jgi:hypothetical protein
MTDRRPASIALESIFSAAKRFFQKLNLAFWFGAEASHASRRLKRNASSIYLNL